MLEFGDNGGSFSSMCFDGSPAFDALRDAPVGAAFEVCGTTDFYQGRFSPKIDSVRRIEGEELDAYVEARREPATTAAPSDAAAIAAPATTAVLADAAASAVREGSAS